MIVEVFSDPICPWCYIGKRRLERALGQDRRETGVTLRWRAFQLNPKMPPDGMARETYVSLKFGGPDRAREVYDAVGRAGDGEGIPFAFERIRRTPNTVDAHRVIRFAARRNLDDGIVEALFRAYFLDGKNIGDRKVLASIGDSGGLDSGELRDYLVGDEDRAEVLADQDAAVSMNITGVPCFIVDGRYAIVGAQAPEAFIPVFQAVDEENRQSTISQ